MLTHFGEDFKLRISLNRWHALSVRVLEQSARWWVWTLRRWKYSRCDWVHDGSPCSLKLAQCSPQNLLHPYGGNVKPLAVNSSYHRSNQIKVTGRGSSKYYYKRPRISAFDGEAWINQNALKQVGRMAYICSVEPVDRFKKQFSHILPTYRIGENQWPAQILRNCPTG